jgi:hypothetical protein
MAKVWTHALSFASAVSLACAVPSRTHAESPPAPAPRSAEPHDGQHDFDFMFGTFKIKVRRLKNPLHGSNEWYEMMGTTVCRPIWNGKANIEEGELDGPYGHMEAAMVRLYSPTSHQWSLNWVNQKNARFDVPTIGEFKDGRGEFYDTEMYEGRSILVRYVWSGTNTSSPHFEQSFSTDGGKTWELNWDAWSTRVE